MQRFMKTIFVLLLFGALCSVQPSPALSAQAGPLDPYIEGAKKEGSVTIGLTLREKSHGKPAASLYVAAFQKRYPFLKVNFKRIGGARERERIVVEMASGIFDYDVATVTDTMIPTIVDAKLPRVVEWQKLGVPAIFAHPKNYGLSLRTQAYGIAYNRDQIPDDVAKNFTWETCTDPKWKGKITMNDRPRHLIVLSRGDAWGQAKTLDYAKRWAANKPAMNESQSDATEKVSLGVFPIGCGLARGQVKDIQVNAGSKSLGIVFPDPVPIDSSDLIYVPDKAKHPNAAILFMVWSTTTEAQNILDDIDFTGHPAIEGNDVNIALKGKKIVYPSWADVANADNRLAEILQAMGVPVVR
jgi:iron(III) transport system substrate-binding protein